MFLELLKSIESTTELEALRSIAMDAAQKILRLDGPPARPIDASFDFREAIVKSPKGTPLATAETWVTGPWRCLMVHCPSIPMGRPRFMEDKETGDMRKFTDSRSQSAMLRISMACRALRLDSPLQVAAVYYLAGKHRTFIAWRRIEPWETFNAGLKGDTDNYAKIALDGMQKAGVVSNDRGVFRLVACKSPTDLWDNPAPDLRALVHETAIQRIVNGEDPEFVKKDLKLSYARMAEIGYPLRSKSSRQPKDPANRSKFDPTKKNPAIIEAIRLVTFEKVTAKVASEQTGCSYSTLRVHLSALGFKAPTGPDALARNPALQEAIRLVTSGENTAKEASDQTGCAHSTLRFHLSKLKKADAPSKATSSPKKKTTSKRSAKKRTK